MNLYMMTLINSFQSAFLLPAHSEYMWFAAKAFGRGDMLFITIMAIMGVTLSMCANYGVGRWIAHIREEKESRLYINDLAYARISRYAGHFIWLFLYPPLPFAAIIAAACGLFRVRISLVIAVVMLGRIGYYGYYLYNN